MANNRRKSAAIALVVLGVAGLSLASASVLGVNTNVLQAGTDPLGQCDTDGVVVSYTYAWDATDVRYEATQAVVSDIDCAVAPGNTIGVTLRAGAATTTIASTAITGATMTIALAPAISAEALSNVDVVIAAAG